MSSTRGYLMENDDEVIRLDRKTDDAATKRQAQWGGIQEGMRVADIGCGSGRTTLKLHDLVLPQGEAIGVDIAEQRVTFASNKYGRPGLHFCRRDARLPLDDLGAFDFVWVRFLLEYYGSLSFDLLKNISGIVKPGGILCAIDLDHNCLSHYGLPARLERAISGIMSGLNAKADFDPYAGRKLYSHLYDLGFEDIRVEVAGHHVIYGDIKDDDAFNWMKKVEVAPKKIGFVFDEYEGGYDEFIEECRYFFNNPRRFTYSPIIMCAGRRPSD